MYKLLFKPISKLSAKWNWLWLSSFVIILDLFTKFLAVKFLSFNSAVKIFPGFNFYLAHNKGSAFSLLANQSGWQHWFFICVASILSIVILIWMKFMHRSRLWGMAGLSLLLGGAIGNLANRALCGYVIDFIDVHVGKHHWPTFNIADIAICIGVVFLIINEGVRK